VSVPRPVDDRGGHHVAHLRVERYDRTLIIGMHPISEEDVAPKRESSYPAEGSRKSRKTTMTVKSRYGLSLSLPDAESVDLAVQPVEWNSSSRSQAMTGRSPCSFRISRKESVKPAADTNRNGASASSAS